MKNSNWIYLSVLCCLATLYALFVFPVCLEEGFLPESYGIIFALNTIILIVGVGVLLVISFIGIITLIETIESLY